MASKSIEWRVPEEPTNALSAFRASQGPLIEKRGYRIDGEGPRSLTYKRRHTFPAERFSIEASASDGGSVITVDGKLHRKLRKAFAGFADQPPVEPETLVEEPETILEELGLEPEEELEAEPEQKPVTVPESSLLREVRGSALMAEGASRRLDAEANGEQIDCSGMRGELKRVYSLAGHPEAFEEAVGKIQALAEELVLAAGCSPDEALYIAYRRSLEEHHEYLAARGISEPVAN